MQYLTNTLLLASLAISNVAAAPVADNSAVQARQDFSGSVKSGPPNFGGNGGNVAQSDYIYTQGDGKGKGPKKHHSQNGAKDGNDHLKERDPQYKYSDDGMTKEKRGQNDAPNVEARNAYIYTQRKERRQDAGSDSIQFSPNDSTGGGPGESKYIYTQKKTKQRRSQNGVEDDAEHLEERSKLPFEPDFGHDKREAYIYTQKKKERRSLPPCNSGHGGRYSGCYEGGHGGQTGETNKRSQNNAAPVEARAAYIYTQKKERRQVPDIEARNAYIYTQKKERRDNSNLQARNAYIYTQKERREAADVEARNAYIYTQKERRAPVEARNAEVDYDGSHVHERRDEMIDVGSA